VNAVILRAPAKINLRLVILAQETTGYHSLETLLCGITLHDTVEIRPGPPGVSLSVTGSIDTGPAEDNLVVRAAKLFYERIGVAPAIAARIEKRIPSGAGLGGGSSDCAAAFLGMNTLHGSPLARSELMTMGAALGSDVPFFLTRSPYALAWSRGERLIELTPPESRDILVVHPPERVATPEAFARLAQLRAERVTMRSSLGLEAASLFDWGVIRSLAVNDFEPVARERIPCFDDVITTLRRCGAVPALLTGSGSALFGIFDSTRGLVDAEEEFAGMGLETLRAATLTRWPEPIVRD